MHTSQRTRRNKKTRRVNRPQLMRININQRSYRNQPLASHWVPGGAQKLTTTVTTGQIAQTMLCDPTTTVTSWTTRFQTLYEEYRILRVAARVSLFSSTTPGLLVLYWDEKSPFTAPTTVASSERRNMEISLSSTNRPLNTTWIAKDLLDLQYTPIATANPPVALQIFTNNSGYGAPITATDVATVELMYLIQFRGFETV